MTNNHHRITHRAIDMLIDNALDELHDRARDDFADAIEPHLDSLRALLRLSHDDACDAINDDALTDDDIFELALDLSTDAPDPDSCFAPIESAILTLLYRAYAD